ncbi:MAG: M23 family metallopeptidase [Crocinitomicaceae bacterium]|nr:M23 family metallopeptidase [Crocinitomicaceae bacterium]
MSIFKRLFKRVKKSVKFSASDPQTFEEVWSFTSTGIRVLSLLLIVLVLISVGVLFLFGGFFANSNGANDVSIERNKLEEQRDKIELLTGKLNNQERYIHGLKMILSGEVPIESNLDSLVSTTDFDYESIEAKPTKMEGELSKKVKDDMRTPKSSTSGPITYFSSPVNGIISQKFDKQNHPGVDVVTQANNTIKACHAGTVIYSGYTRKDGYILIIDHANDYISVYKHNKTVLKKMGAKVQLGDPIAIVGNTGENTDGPHLHFELWFDQMPVNPSDYIKFKR